jgi:hypothetical protein
MDGVGGRLGSAQARWNDYVGTAAADDAAALLATRSLYELSDLDRDRWTIVGMDFSRGAASEQVVIYAMDRAAGVDVDPDTGDLNVTAIHLAKTTAMDSFIQEAFNQISVRLVSSAVRDKRIVVGRTIT